jgi:hypothetical protein
MLAMSNITSQANFDGDVGYSNYVRKIYREGTDEGTVVLLDGQRLRKSRAGRRKLNEIQGGILEKTDLLTERFPIHAQPSAYALLTT